MNLSACIVLYYPNLIEVEKNIKSYINSVDKLYVIDNTPAPFSETKHLTSLSTKIEYLPNYGNFGIAKALNQSFQNAIADGFNWIVTFDQDSYCLPNTINILKEIASQDKIIGSVSPVYVEDEAHIVQQIKDWQLKNQTIEVDAVITSCCLTNIEAYKFAGGFNEELFIDLVDVDFSFKLRENGFKVLITNKTSFIHSLGNKNYFNFWQNKKISYTNHSAIRRYYITRNRLWFSKKYKNKHPIFCKNELKNIVKEAIKILLFEEKKIPKAKAIFFAFLDYYKGLTGKTNREF